MKKRVLFFVSVAALVLSSCGKTATPGPNDASRSFFLAWLKVNYPDAKPVRHGVYIVEETPGTTKLGSAVDYPYVSLDYVYYDLAGDIQGYTDEKTAKQLGEYTEQALYGPDIFYRGENGMNIGMADAISGMDVGGERLVIIPGWLNSSTVYDTEEEYIANVTGNDGVYRFKLREQIKDIVKWEIDSLVNYVGRNFGLQPKDSLQYGYYYARTGKPKSEIEFPKDTTIKINYIGRLLNGKVFDTTIRDTAVLYGIYNPNTTYGSQSVTFAEDYTEIKLGSSTIIKGFAYTLSKMHPGESGSGIFYSALGYGATGSGKSIPKYSPLRFDIYIVDK